MGKVIEKIKLTSLFDATKTMEVDAVIDTGATMLGLPQNLIQQLNLRRLREVTVKYANNDRQQKFIYAALFVEIKGRIGTFDVLAEAEGSEPLVGQMILEELDLVVEPGSRRLVPNPRSPEMPMVEIL